MTLIVAGSMKPEIQFNPDLKYKKLRVLSFSGDISFPINLNTLFCRVDRANVTKAASWIYYSAAVAYPRKKPN